jgi:ubiquinone/menaquinone biosynthesis C-methylase UbiE
MKQSSRRDYLPALGLRALTRWYDPVVALTTREQVVKGHLLDHAALRPGLRVLDLGCGTGTLSLMAKQREPGAHVTGVDGDSEILERAQAKAVGGGVEISFVHGLSTALPLQAATYDCVVCSLFLHHLWPEQRLATLREVQRVLRDGGRFLVADWGAPRGAIARAGFTLVRLLDGFARTREHAAGGLSALFAAAEFEAVTQVDEVTTPLGTMDLFTMRAPSRQVTAASEPPHGDGR